MRQLVIIILSLSFYSQIALAQFSKLSEINTSSDYFSVDNKNNIYFTKGEYLYQSKPPYLTKSSYFLGKHDYNCFIDVSNSNQILLFFPEIQKIITLDSALKETARPLYLDEIGMLDISLISSSPKSGYWFYNQSNNSLTRLDDLYLPIVKAINLNSFFTYPKMPTYLCAQNDKVFLNIPSEGVLIMSDLGRFITMASLPGLIDFQVSGEDIIFYRDGHIHFYNIRKQHTKTIMLPNCPDVINALYSSTGIFLQTTEKIIIYDH